MDIVMVIILSLGFLTSLATLGGLAWVWLQTEGRMHAIQEKLAENAVVQEGAVRSFGHIQHTLGQLSETSRHMERVGREIAGLGALLKAPKMRGGLGELLLADLLGQILSPDHFEMNHAFRSGHRVDAVIRLQAGMVPVDAKFPLESFQRMLASPEGPEHERARREFSRAVKAHLDDIARKYILPDEGTFEFALMYIPAENVYYETIIKDEALGEQKGILQHALERRVLPVSPNSFYAYLQALVMGLRGLRIEKQAQAIQAALGRLEGDFRRFRDEYVTLGGHLERARNKYEEADRLLHRFGEKLETTRAPGLPEPGREPVLPPPEG